jgi:hypothetical protein
VVEAILRGLLGSKDSRGRFWLIDCSITISHDAEREDVIGGTGGIGPVASESAGGGAKSGGSGRTFLTPSRG